MSLSIGLLGLGAIGTVMASYWRQHTVFVLGRCAASLQHARTEHQYKHKRSLTYGPAILNQHPEWPEALTLSLPQWNHQRLDWLVVTTKAGDTLEALLPYASQLHRVERILLLQNGMGQHEQLAHWLKKQGLPCELWRGTSTDGAYRLDKTRVMYAGLGHVWVGQHRSNPARLCTLPTSCRLPHTEVVTDILARQREKLAINAVINPLTAHYRCLNGELASNIRYRQQLQALATEVEQFFLQLGWPLQENLFDRVIQIALSTAQNRSSSLQDVLANKATELRHISGYLLTQANTSGIELPLTRALMDQVNDRTEHGKQF